MVSIPRVLIFHKPTSTLLRRSPSLPQADEYSTTPESFSTTCQRVLYYPRVPLYHIPASTLLLQSPSLPHAREYSTTPESLSTTSQRVLYYTRVPLYHMPALLYYTRVPLYYKPAGTPLYHIFYSTFHTLSGRTGSALVWHSEGRTIEADSMQQVL